MTQAQKKRERTGNVEEECDGQIIELMINRIGSFDEDEDMISHVWLKM